MVLIKDGQSAVIDAQATALNELELRHNVVVLAGADEKQVDAFKKENSITHSDENVVALASAPKEMLEFIQKPHAYNEDIYLQCLEGVASFTLHIREGNDKEVEYTLELQKNDLLTIPKNMFHTMTLHKQEAFKSRGFYQHDPAVAPEVSFKPQ